MNRALLVGDVHATPEELDDCRNLMDFVMQTAFEQKVVHVILMGDTYNTHNVMRVEVLAFWRKTFKQMNERGFKTSVLVGNHDYAGEGLTIHALQAHEDQVLVVDRPTELFSGVVMLPYFSDTAEFVFMCEANSDRPTVLCHQTFDGSRYENGFYAPGGVDQNLLPQDFVISGHIHTPQSFGKVTYIGAPRWRSLADANVSRAIWLYGFGEDGGVLGAQSFDTGIVCRQIKTAEHTPENPCTADLSDGSDWRVDVKGPADWIEAEKTQLARPGVKLRTFRTDRVAPRVKESEGVDQAFEKFMGHYVPRYGTEKERLVELAKERLRVV